MPKATAETRSATWTLLRWCPEAGVYQDADAPVCHWDHGDGVGRHRLRLRRVLVCDRCEMAFRDGGEFVEHECFSAY